MGVKSYQLDLILVSFENLFGLKVNLQKSKLTRVGTILDLRQMLHTLDCQVIELPTANLGLPLGAKYTSKAI